MFGLILFDPLKYPASAQGIEYSKGRCELWTRVDGIFIAKELNGFTCCSAE